MENNTRLKSTPKDVFLHLFNILTFYISVIGFIRLYVLYISALFPDPLNYYFTYIADGVRWATSMLVIAVPVYLLTSWLIAKDFAHNPKMRELSLRKWLLYLTLFISAVTIIIDLIIFVNNFLSGELTIQFFLKILVVLVVAVVVFWYYIWDLRRKNLKSKIPKILVWIVSVVVLASIIMGFYIIGTPADQRDRRFDDQRVENLQMLQGEIVNFWIQKESLPEKLNQLEDSISGFAVPVDPKSGQPYEYNVTDPLSFELCATFNSSSQDFSSLAKGTRPFSPYDSFQQNWEHEAGQTCFTRTIDPELYKDSQNDTGLKPLLGR
ncbi:hypothetical protein KKF32_02355 [Patescibacteria group bacterium]|nr:hypothetical protein [Patescibacteria group bacterium]